MTFRPILDFIGGPLLLLLFLLLFALEGRRPLRRRVQSRWERLLTNGTVAATAAVTMRLALVPVVLWTAGRAEAARFGLLYLLPGPAPLRMGAGLLLFDYTIYVWHRLNHVVPFLWRFHNVHHTDLDLDVSTAFRFHFGELLLSVLWRSAQVALLGIGPALALGYEIALEAATEFHHSNWRLPLKVEAALNRVLVTPRMHGIHHSIVERETNSNWSTMFSWWDRLHRTVRLDIPQDALVIGTPAYRDPGELGFLGLLRMPFRRQRVPWRLPDGSHPDRLASADPSRIAG